MARTSLDCFSSMNCTSQFLRRLGSITTTYQSSFGVKIRFLTHRSMYKDGDEIPPLVIGFSAPQGCGKDYPCLCSKIIFQHDGQCRLKLREENPGNALLEVAMHLVLRYLFNSIEMLRGNAGSHDLSLSIETLTAISK
ncbi:D-glycerate 3-kinase, chloroplastic, partial [Vitis vinifera]